VTPVRQPVAIVTGAARGVTPAELGAAVRWIVRQPASFTGHVLTFQRLREFGALPVHDTGGVR
jgi:hypothetical protein